MKFFLPDWDDRVDPGYDFRTDRFSLVRDPYRDDVYAHELFGEKPYDGLLVSRMALLNTGAKRQLIERIGMRAYLRLPGSIELLGDCGAFGYLREKLPLFDTEEVARYYEQLNFDYGVSVDHVIVPEFESERQFRFDLTLSNARDFLDTHRERGYRFHPIGACQGWDEASYSEAASELCRMGYDYIAVGGLARSDTRTIAHTIAAVAASVPTGVRLHVFGVARLSVLPMSVNLGITSVDSAAPLRQAWLSANDNYYTLERTYAAIRISDAKDERPKSTTLVGRSQVGLSELTRAEFGALKALRDFDRGRLRVRTALDAILAYDELLATRRYAHTPSRRKELYQRTLEDRPWKSCGCEICDAIGVEVIIFRGNNRNRRRGFHNLRMVQRRMKRAQEQVRRGDLSDEASPALQLRLGLAPSLEVPSRVSGVGSLAAE